MYAFEFKVSCSKCGIESSTQLQIWKCKNCNTVNVIDFSGPVQADLKLDDGRVIKYKIQKHNSKFDIKSTDLPYWALPEMLLFFAVTIICMVIIGYYGVLGVITNKTYYYISYIAAAVIIFIIVSIILFLHSSMQEKKYLKIINMYLKK